MFMQYELRDGCQNWVSAAAADGLAPIWFQEISSLFVIAFICIVIYRNYPRGLYY